MRCRPVLLAAVAVCFSLPVSTALAQTPCPVEAVGPYPCAVTTLAALPSQADALGLTDAQLAAVDAIRETELQAVHDVIGDIRSLQETFHMLDRPYDVAEVFALFHELGAHQAELDVTIRAAARALLAELTEGQRARWAELLAEAATLHDPDAAGAFRGD